MLRFLLAFAFLTALCGADHHEGHDHVSRLLASYRAKEKAIERMILNRDIDKGVRPPGKDAVTDPVKVKLSMYINDLGLCKKYQELSVGGYFRQRWNDPRLAIDLGETGITTMMSTNVFENRRIWIPDTFSPADRLGFSREKFGHSFFRVKCCGGVLLSVKFRTKFACPFNEDQNEVTCSVSFESYAYGAEDMVYEWVNDGLMIDDVAKQLMKNQGWELVSSDISSGVNTFATGNYSEGKIVFKFVKTP